MKAYRRRDIVAIILIAAFVSGWWLYTHTDSFRARKLITELSYLRSDPRSPTGTDRVIFVASLATPRSRTLDEVIAELATMGDAAVPFLIEELRSNRDLRWGARSNVCSARDWFTIGSWAA